MVTGTVSTPSLAIQNDQGALAEIRAQDGGIRLAFDTTTDSLSYKTDAAGPKAPDVGAYWEIGSSLQVDGDVAVTGKVTMKGATTGSSDAVTKAYADSIAVVPASLNDATDVEYTGVPIQNQVLAWTGSVWTNKSFKTAYWTEVFHYNGNMSGGAVSMVTGAGAALSVSPPYSYSIDTLSISAYNLPDAGTHTFTVVVKKHDGTTLATLSSGAMPQKTVMGTRAAWASVGVTPFTIANTDAIYLQLSGYTGTGIAVAVQLSQAQLQN